MNNYPPVISGEYWQNSQLSIARHYGMININGDNYTIVDKDGTDVFTLAMKAEEEGRDNAIEEGQPCDLVRNDFIPVYRLLGRELVFELLQEKSSEEEIYEVYNTLKEMNIL